MDVSASVSRRPSVFYYLAVAFVLVYVSAIIFSNFVNWDQFLPFMQQNFAVNTHNSFLLGWLYNVRLTNDIIYPGRLKVAYILLLLAALWAGLALSKGRSIWEAFGLFFFWMIPRPNYFWGRVTDRNTGKVMSFCRIEIQAEDLKTGDKTFIKETVTDLYGRYRINFAIDDQHHYTMAVLASGYQPFIKDIRWDLDQNVTIYSDIELIPVNEHGNSTRTLLRRLRINIDNNIVKYLYFVSLISLFLIFLGFWRSIEPWTLMYIFIATVAFVWNSYVFFVFNKQHYGRFILADNGEPIGNLLVSLFLNGVKLATAATNKDGNVSFSVEPGKYELKILSSGVSIVSPTGEPILDETPLVDVTVKGFLARNIYVTHATTQTNASTASLLNPFA